MLKLSHFQVLHFYLLFYLQNLIFPMYVCMHVCTYVRMYVCQNTRKSRYQTFLFLSSFTGFLYFVPNILPRILGTNNCLLQTLIFWQFVYYQSISPVFKENIKQVSCVKIPNLMVLCKQYFPYLV